MQFHPLLTIAFACLSAGLASAQDLPPTVPLAAREHQARAPMDPKGFGWVFNVNGKQYEAKISLEQIAAGLGWTPAAALPLSFAKAEEIARGELRKLVTDDSTWEVTELNLRRSGEQADSKWFYLVKLMPKVRERNAIADSFTLPISFSGAIGRVQLYGLAR